MWKNGSTPISVSSLSIRCSARVCSMLATRLRCVSITPFDRPVVPEENGSTARSPAGSTAAGSPGSAPAGRSSSVKTRATSLSASDGRSGSATITAPASAVCSCEATSLGLSSGLIDVTVAPSEIAAW